LDRLVSALAKLGAWLGAFAALLVAAMVVTSVVGRASPLAKPIQGDVELTQLGIALAISLGLPWCQLRRANIIVDFFTQGASDRTRGWLDGLGCWLVALMVALLAWRTSAGALAVRAAGETSMILALPMWWVYAALAPGLALTALIAAWQGLRLLRRKPLGALAIDMPNDEIDMTAKP
jgi:TRAP-type C4-dicarboxylate transport system permease small subunit